MPGSISSGGKWWINRSTVYRFNLESLLRHRKFIEDAKQKELALIQGQLNYELRQLMVLKEKLMQTVNEFVVSIEFYLDAPLHFLFILQKLIRMTFRYYILL